MLRFYAESFVGVAREIERGAEQIKHLNDEGVDQPLADEWAPHFQQSMDNVRQMCEHIELDSPCDQVKRIMFQINKPTRLTPRELLQLLIDLQNRIEDQLGRRVYYQLDPRRSHLYGNQAPFGEDVNSRFPKAVKDLREAANCYAVFRNVATVYHLMKVMEVVLKELARKLRVPYSPSWGIYLQRIDDKLKAKTAKSKAKRIRLQFLAECASRLRAVKDAWRDPTMHVAAEYFPDQTTAIYNSVLSFMIFMKDI